jgi:putative addiction module component (TIGR02574 family)
MANALELLEEAMTLPRAERSFVAERLLESLDYETPLSAEWSEEIARRIARRESGESRVYTREEMRE